MILDACDTGAHFELLSSPAGGDLVEVVMFNSDSFARTRPRSRFHEVTEGDSDALDTESPVHDSISVSYLSCLAHDACEISGTLVLDPGEHESTDTNH